jgi:predicted protein tyrosine phosphatase
MRVLFVCSRNRLRSPTAAQVFSSWPGVETDSGGVAPDADHVLEAEQVAWADLIVVMERRHQRRVTQLFPREAKAKRIVSLDIPDDYTFMQPELVALLEARAGPHLKR